jgi:hypothetical protein
MEMNLQTLSMSPQYHVVFDDWCSSVTTDGEVDPAQPDWSDLFIGSRYISSFEPDEDVCLADEWNDVLGPIASEHNHCNDMMTRAKSSCQRERETSSTSNVSTMTPSTLISSIAPIVSTTTSSTSRVSTPIRDNTSQSSLMNTSSPISIQSPTPSITTTFTPLIIDNTESSRRSGRNCKPPICNGYYGTQGLRDMVEVYKTEVRRRNKLMSFHKSLQVNTFVQPDIEYLMACYSDHDAGAIDYPDSELFAVVHNTFDNNTYKYHRAIVQPDWDDFYAALKVI